MADDLVLDPDIRIWVFVPIIIITFLVGIVRHYVSILLSTQKKVELLQVQDSQAMIRARVLRENGKYLPEQSFLMRRHFFNDEDTGYFKTQKRTARAPNPMSDPNMVTEMLKGNVTNVLPMLVIGGWINWTFSGFVCSKGMPNKITDKMNFISIESYCFGSFFTDCVVCLFSFSSISSYVTV